MKMFLLKLTAFALVATSTVHAVDEPYVLRGSVGNEEMMVALQASCSQGSRDGQKSVKKLWKRSGEDCDNAWDLERQANKMKSRNYPRKSRNWRDRAYNRCAREGADNQVQKVEKQCLNNDPSQCTDLGETAAEIIVFDNVCQPQFDSQAVPPRPPDYKETCREVAYGICQGQISAKINEYCADSNVRSNRLLRLMDKCEDQVDKMVGTDDVESMSD
eukprot:111167_1